MDTQEESKSINSSILQGQSIIDDNSIQAINRNNCDINFNDAVINMLFSPDCNTALIDVSVCCDCEIVNEIVLGDQSTVDPRDLIKIQMPGCPMEEGTLSIMVWISPSKHVMFYEDIPDPRLAPDECFNFVLVVDASQGTNYVSVTNLTLNGELYYMGDELYCP